jgi:hypothetical protein
MPATVEIKAITPRKTRNHRSKPMSLQQLRNQCALQGINWRSGGDYGKSMKKAQMLAALR